MNKKMKEKSKKLRKSIGYALSQNKIDKLITQSLITHAKNQGIELIPIDLHQPSLQHPPLDFLIHKPFHHDWKLHLLDFQSKHPNVHIIDSHSAIDRVNNRVSMLSFIPKITLPPSPSSQSNTPTFGIPPQILLLQDNKDHGAINLRFPVVAKPLIADGTPDSHKISLVFKSDGLQRLKHQAPLVLQEFVNHGGVMFKVYVAGRHVKCVQRNSLPDFHLCDLSFEHLQEGVLQFTRVSNLPTTISSLTEQTVSMPPLEFINSLATALREATKLHLFNFDLIRDASENGDRYLIIDINYFPGFEKLKGYENMLTDFFLDVIQKHDTINLS